MWLYISAYIILLGGVVNAERDRMLERQKSAA
jgi:uncharacterized BrkB/YihY/UPF0761 family membrane protein